MRQSSQVVETGKAKGVARESRRRQRKKGCEGDVGCETVRRIEPVELVEGAKEKSARCLQAIVVS